MQRSFLIAVIAMVSALAACERTPPDDTQRAPVQSPSAVGTTPSPSDAKDPAFMAPETTAGSAVGGTQGGNVTDPQATTPKGPPVESRKAPQPTGGDGTPEGEKGSPK